MSLFAIEVVHRLIVGTTLLDPLKEDARQTDNQRENIVLRRSLPCFVRSCDDSPHVMFEMCIWRKQYLAPVTGENNFLQIVRDAESQAHIGRHTS